MADGGTVTTHHDITEQRRSEAKIAHMALHDTLTGLPNRVLLNERLEHALRRVKRGEIVAIHLLDLDHFKTVNDTLGPPGGRQAPADGRRSPARRWCARRTRSRAWAATSSPSSRRQSRSPPTPPRSRIASSRRVSAPYEIEGHQVVIGTSVGIAVGPSDGADPRSADPQRRSGALPRQGRRARHLPLLRARDGRADAGAARAGGRPAQGAAGRRVRAALPAGPQSRRATR